MKIFRNIAALFILATLAGCDSFLTEDPIDEMGENSFYNNDSDINQAVLACYAGLRSTIEWEWLMTEMRSDNTRHDSQNSDATGSLEMYEFDRCRVLTTNPRNDTYWETTYHNIANCNTVLKYIDVVKNPVSKAQYEGEARFLRAYHYFNLVRLYGPVFLVDRRISANEALNFERTSVAQTYDFIKEDLKFAAANLPDNYASSQLGRVDAWAAKAMLAKVYMTLGEFSQAHPLLDDVIKNSRYTLVEARGSSASAYANVFSIGNEMNGEMMFVARYKAGGFGTGSPFANYFAPSGAAGFITQGTCNGYNCPTEDIVEAYESGDQRKAASFEYTWENLGGIVYRSYITKFHSAVVTAKDAENDWPILRYADVLLMMAETENELNGPDDAFQYINKTRVRAGLAALTSADVADQDAFRSAVDKERRVELAFENHRLFDLLRTNRYVEVMKNHYETEKFRATNGNVGYYYLSNNPSAVTDPILQEWQKLLPIPYSVMSVAPYAIQNPGY